MQCAQRSPNVKTANHQFSPGIMKYGGGLSERQSICQANLPRSNLSFKVPETDNRLKRKVLEGNTKDGGTHSLEIANPGTAEEEADKCRFATQYLFALILKITSGHAVA